MDSKSASKLTFLLFLNLACYFLAPATACNTCSGGAQPPPTCPIDALKLGVCATLVGGLVDVRDGSPSPPTAPCCSMLAGLMDFEAAVCLCTVIKANISGIIVRDIPVALSMLLNACGKTETDGFVCAY
ncbi:hypothetical protein CASFOL_008435 [Castilleja foliolosa]|uniref:Bifunctional inhibitor/plant lipid transfer protein/seed storage helical domain-containing protein n=1 Tax=Castilleja foliolosa TaxID=1961234 RepID=A0ABD3E0Y8_9LAMI